MRVVLNPERKGGNCLAAQSLSEVLFSRLLWVGEGRGRGVFYRITKAFAFPHLGSNVMTLDVLKGNDLLKYYGILPRKGERERKNRGLGRINKFLSIASNFTLQNLHCIWNHKHRILTVLVKVKLICSFDFH